MYETGGMRRTHLRGHKNILKRLVVHAGACNLGLIMRQRMQVGTPRGLQDRRSAILAIQVLIMLRVMLTVLDIEFMDSFQGQSGDRRPRHIDSFRPPCAHYSV